MSTCVFGEKKEVFGKELWKALSETYSTFQKVFGFLLLSIQKDVYKEIFIKEVSNKTLKHDIQFIRHKSYILNSVKFCIKHFHC